MTDLTVPKNPIVLRREYLITARKVAVQRPDETDVAMLIALTEALLRDVCKTPNAELRLYVPL